MSNKKVSWQSVRQDVLRLVRVYKQYHASLGCLGDWKKCMIEDIEFIIHKKRKLKSKLSSSKKA